MTKQIQLTKGLVTLIDDDMFEHLNQWTWHGAKGGKYAARREGKLFRRTFYMHRVVSNAPDGVQVDHINGNSLDNRRENLRLCTNSENQRNRGAPANNTSGFKGVSFDNRTLKKWCAKITVNGIQIHLGRFDTPEEAAYAYDAAAKEHFGEFAWTNF